MIPTETSLKILGSECLKKGFPKKIWPHGINQMLDIKCYIFFGLLSVEQRKHVVFGSETEEGESIDYEANMIPEVDVNDKEDEFKKVFIMK